MAAASPIEAMTMNFTYRNDWVPLAQLVVALPLAVLLLCHPLVSCPLFALACCHIASPCPLVAPYSLPLVTLAGCCVASRHAALLLSHCLVEPLSRCLVTPAGCRIISSRPLLLELASSEPLTLDEEVHMQEKWQWHHNEKKCTFIILASDLLLLDLDIVDNNRPSVAVASPSRIPLP